MTNLPWPIPKSKWITVTDEFRRTEAYYPALVEELRDTIRRPGWNPKTVQMAGHMVAIDLCVDHTTRDLHSYRVALVMDHPFLSTLPKNAPRAVRHPYYAASRMKYLRMKDGWDFLGDWNRAEEAWAKYRAGSSALKQQQDVIQ